MSSAIKRIPVAGSGKDIDTSKYQDLFDSPELRRLSYLQQVTLAEDRYVGSRHTRLEHSLGVFYYAQKLTEVLKLSDEEATTLLIASLFHDIGHPAFSHGTECLVSKPHEQRSIELVRGMKCIDKYVDREKVAEVLSENDNGLSKILSSILGADKLDYIERDLYHCGLGGQGVSEGIISHAVVKREDGKLIYGVEYEGGNAVTNFLKTWWSAHHDVYLHPSVETNRAMMQRAVFFTFSKDEMDTLFELVDRDVYYIIENSHDEDARRLALNLRRGDFHEPLVTFKLDGCEKHAESKGAVYTITKTEKDQIINNIPWLVEKEKELCKYFDVPKGAILITPSQDYERLDPDKKYCVIFMGNMAKTPLSATYPDFSSYLKEEMKRHYEARIIVEKKHLQAVKDKLGGKNPKSLIF